MDRRDKHPWSELIMTLVFFKLNLWTMSQKSILPLFSCVYPVFGYREEKSNSYNLAVSLFKLGFSFSSDVSHRMGSKGSLLFPSCDHSVSCRRWVVELWSQSQDLLIPLLVTYLLSVSSHSIIGGFGMKLFDQNNSSGWNVFWESVCCCLYSGVLP